MDSSDREKERLRRLSELYERSDLSDEQYRHEYEKISAEFEEVSHSSSTLPTIDALGFEGVTSGKETLPPLAAKADSSPVASSAAHSSGLPNSDGARDTFSSGSMPHIKPTVAMRCVRPRANQYFFAPLVLLLGFCMAIAIGMVRGSKVGTVAITPGEPLIESAQVQGGKDSTPQFIIPLFGPDAVTRCQARCGRWGEQERRVCNRGCKRRNIEMYGRRITLEELNPKREAEQIVASCSTATFAAPRAENNAKWREKLRPFITGITEAEKGKGAYHSRTLYQELYTAQDTVLLPPEVEGDESTTQILKTACLVAQDALALWAFETVERLNDDFSAGFYAQLRDELAQPKFESLNAAQVEIAKFSEEFTP